MSDDKRIGKPLPEGDWAREGQLDSPALVRRDAQREVAGWCSAGVRGSGKAQAFASRLGVSEGFLSHACSGAKVFPSWGIAAFKGDVGATLGFTAALLHSIDHIAVPANPDLKLSPEQFDLLLAMHDTLGEAAFLGVMDRIAVQTFQVEPPMLMFAFRSHMRMGGK